MAEQWIDAATALHIVTRPFGDVRGLHSLCERAYAGLVKTKARVLAARDRQVENVDIPPVFCWACGYEALEQNWISGDFSTIVEEEWRAFGVTFGLTEVLDMLPTELRAVTARRLSVAGNAAWMPARQAILFAAKAPGVISGPAAILEHARLGLLTGRAVLAQRFDGPIVSLKPSREEREWDVPDWFWQGSIIEGRSSQNWEHGRFHAEGPGPNGDCLMRLSGVHFLIESLQVLMPPAEPASQAENTLAAVTAQSGAGGRPSAEWWDDMWCAVWGLIYEGKLIPKKQADVEKAMQSWGLCCTSRSRLPS